MAGLEKRAYEFGPFRIDTIERLLFRSGEMVPLTPKAVDTLLALVANHGRMLEKDELMKLIWPDSFVEEGGLTRNISILRKVFEEGGSEYIETIPKRGYRFLAPVQEVAATVPKRRGLLLVILLVLALIGVGYFRFVQAKTSGIGSLVVLPLQNPSNDPAQEYFSEGMTEDLINALARIEALRVISRTSAMTYKNANKPLPEIARELNVDAVLEGSVVQSGGRVRITVRLFDKAEKQLWAQDYQQDLRDVLTLQNEVASAIAGEIRVKLTPREKNSLAASRSVNPEAYLDYSYGRYYWNKRAPDDIQKAIDYFQRAISKDSNYAPPHAGLADAFAQLGSVGIDALRPEEAMSKAKAAALQAVKLDDALAEGHASLAYARMSYDWDLDAAQREFQRAVQLNPGYATAHHWYAHYFLARNQPEQAIAEIKRAQSLDPLSSIINVGMGWCLYQARRYDEAIQQYRSTLDLNQNFSLTHCTLGMAYEGKHQYQDAISEYNKALTLPVSRPFALTGLGRSYALSGERGRAAGVLDELERTAQHQYVPAVYFAGIYSALGDSDQSVNWLRKAYDERSDYMVYLRTDPWADSLRGDSRFKELLQRIRPRP